ncbi:hypothetical protein GM661_18715 [Iocasia frigidifontis]|uniref:Uncharacterized protein n=1 Tax=Iocasia fonsfrigidae TaxID=2682810 RepID=A0A8A7KPW1_9FIRM|nr:hypothetical protein [Iocasia fonsfrigidae]QTL99842.1 hypothetical protein GM661_18715 [Iocasia fonsfrigidae]
MICFAQEILECFEMVKEEYEDLKQNLSQIQKKLNIIDYFFKVVTLNAVERNQLFNIRNNTLLKYQEIKDRLNELSRYYQLFLKYGKFEEELRCVMKEVEEMVKKRQKHFCVSEVKKDSDNIVS